MGSDDIFKNSKAQRIKDKTYRSSGTKEPLKRILIVSEGIKTEPMYFIKLIDYLKLSNTDIKVIGSKKSCPLKVVEYAKKLQDKSINNGSYDLVYCVIDKDSHVHYENVLSFIKNNKKSNLILINSIPCFEFWILLHYNYNSIKPFMKKGNNSICEMLIKELKKHLPNYTKNISTLDKKDLEYIFHDKNITKAINASKKIIAHCEKAKTDNPSTKIHEVVMELQKEKIKQDNL